MTTIDQLFTDIARKHLFIETLEERKSDRLDFHDVSVLTVKDALQAAYDAGAASASIRATQMLAALEAFIQADDLAEECHEWKWENLQHAFRLARAALAEAEATADERRPL